MKPSRIVVASLMLMAAYCKPRSQHDHPPGSSANVATSAVSSAPATRLATQLSGLQPAIVQQACNRTDSASVFLSRTPDETQALIQRLNRGPIAVRYHDCKVELLPDCEVSGHGELVEAHSCCETPIGCVGGEGIDCYAGREQSWLGNAREWLLNLPELSAASSLGGVGAIVVTAGIRRAYRLNLRDTPRVGCAEATHVIGQVRFGSLRIESEAERESFDPPARRVLVADGSAETTVDVGLVALTDLPAPRTARPCMGLAGYRGTWAPAAFQGQLPIEPPPRCAIECRSGVFDCAVACLQGVKGTCERGLRGRSPELDAKLDAACVDGFGESCGGPGARMEALIATCEHGGDRSARVCGELSKLAAPGEALKYAWLACERGRFQCEHAAELLRASNQMADPRYEQALRYGCASGHLDLCCPLGESQASRKETNAEGLSILRDYCAKSQQVCCRALKARGQAVPQRQKRPD